ncbi:MAG: hypothetical protein WCR40_02475 [Candidatus Paceibacterota bacterium]
MEQEPQKEILEKSSLEYCYELETEVNLFYKWLFERNQKFHWDLIYKNFPELTDIHINPENLSEEELHLKIKEVILKFREKYANNINLAEDNIKSELPNISGGINSLENLMGESKHFKYLVMPSVYPICPFDIERNLFYFSITGVKDNKVKDERFSKVTLHEISHFIFFRQIANISNKLSDRGIHHLKEILTPVLLQHPNIIKHRQDDIICGNRESIEYQVEKDGKILSIYDYVNNEFLKNPTPEGYMSFLHWLIALFERIEPEVIERDNLFAKNGQEIFSNPELNKKFMKPIKL